MKLIFALTAAATLTFIGLGPASADAPATVAATPAAVAATPKKYTLDTPIIALVADPLAKAVIVSNLPDLITHPQYDQFNNMSLNELSRFAPDKLTPAVLGKVQDDLAKLN
jgi:hypothetical protein